MNSPVLPFLESSNINRNAAKSVSSEMGKTETEKGVTFSDSMKQAQSESAQQASDKTSQKVTVASEDKQKIPTEASTTPTNQDDPVDSVDIEEPLVVLSESLNQRLSQLQQWVTQNKQTAIADTQEVDLSKDEFITVEPSLDDNPEAMEILWAQLQAPWPSVNGNIGEKTGKSLPLESFAAFQRTSPTLSTPLTSAIDVTDLPVDVDHTAKTLSTTMTAASLLPQQMSINAKPSQAMNNLGETLSTQLLEGFSEATPELKATIQTALESLTGPMTTSPAQTPSVTSGIKPQLSMAVPFQQSQWGEAVAEKVVWMNTQGIKEAEIHIDPPELGPIQVKVSVTNDQAQVSFVVQHASVREALDQSAMRLRELFAGDGLNLTDVDVSDQSQQQAHEQGEDSSGRYGSSEYGSGNEMSTENEELVMHSTPLSSLGLVNTYV